MKKEAIQKITKLLTLQAEEIRRYNLIIGEIRRRRAIVQKRRRLFTKTLEALRRNDKRMIKIYTERIKGGEKKLEEA